MIHRPDWQALLFLPVKAERHLASAIRHRPDAVVLDLEDAVAPSAKAAARIVLCANQAQLAEAGIDCVLRVNGAIRAMVEDLSAADHSLLHGVMVLKCEDAHSLRNAADLTDGAVAAIHPTQIPVIRATLAPTEAAVKWADDVLAGVQAGGGVFALEGQMVDAPVVARARHIRAALRRHGKSTAGGA